MEKNTDPKENTAEESIEASEIEELVHNEATTEDSSQDEAFTAHEINNVIKERSLLQEGKMDDLKKEPTRNEQVDTEKTPKEHYKQNVEMAEELEANEGTEDAQEPIIKTLPSPSGLELVAALHETTESDFGLPKIEPRFKDDFDEVSKISGDFLILGRESCTPYKFYKFYKYMDQDGKEEEEEEEEKEESIETGAVAQLTSIDRALYYEKYKTLTALMKDERLENNLLQKKISLFYRKRKMYHLIKDTTVQKCETQQKYYAKLDTYAELLEIDSRQRQTVSEELENLRETRKITYYKLVEQFRKLQEREKEVGTGLINFKTGNPIPDKVLERLIRLQKFEMEQLSQMRLKFIKLKYLVAEKQENIDSIDKIGEGLYLMDFEQLKVENRGLSDKIEERDEELVKLRNKCQDTIQILAHIREKISALEKDTIDLKIELTVAVRHTDQNRSELNSLKQERDYFRNMSNKLQNESGLLTELELLRDMEQSMGDLHVLTEDLENLQEENAIKTKQIRNIRRNIESAQEDGVYKSYKNIPEKPSSNPQLLKRRPSIFPPTLPKNAFRHLKYFKPKSSIVKNKTR